MKKLWTIVLIAAFTFALTAPAFAAPTFTDVPAKHWAYDAVTKLAKAGLIEGYGDGTFRGDRPMNRYEFAVLTVKAIDRFDRADETQKQLIDKLAAEFAAELNRMGARLAKVEAKTKTWLVGGDARFRYYTNNPKDNNANKVSGVNNTDWRVRLKFAGTVNDNTTVQGRLTTNYGIKFGATDSNFGSYVNVDTFNLTTKGFLGLDNFRLGRTPLDFIGCGLIGKPLNVDGITIYDTIGALKFTGFTGNIKPAEGVNGSITSSPEQMTTAQIAYKVSPDFQFGLGYYWSDIPGYSNVATGGMLANNGAQFKSSKGYDLSIKAKLAGLNLLADYVGTTLNRPVNVASSPKGWAVQLSNGNGPGATMAYYPTSWLLVRPTEKGANAFAIGYRSVDAGTIPAGAGGFDTTALATPATYSNVYMHGTDNSKALYLVWQTVMDKNVTLSLEYQDFQLKNRGMTSLTDNKLDTTFMVKVDCYF